MAIHNVAMHMSDGIVNAPTSLLFGVIAVIALGLCSWRAREELDERAVPLAGLVAAFIFAVQMVNFPILPGVSGHLLGGALAAILVGPYTGALCIAIVLVVQSLLFADGGVTAPRKQLPAGPDEPDAGRLGSLDVPAPRLHSRMAS